MAGEPSFKMYKRISMQTARDLFYGEEVIDRIREAKNEIEIDNILRQARLEDEE